MGGGMGRRSAYLNQTLVALVVTDSQAPVRTIPAPTRHRTASWGTHSKSPIYGLSVNTTPVPADIFGRYRFTTVNTCPRSQGTVRPLTSEGGGEMKGWSGRGFGKIAATVPGAAAWPIVGLALLAGQD